MVRDTSDYGSGGFEEMTLNGVITEARLRPSGGLVFTAVILSTGEPVRGFARSDDAADAVLENFGRPVAITGLVYVDESGEPLFIDQADAVEPIAVEFGPSALRIREESP